MAGPRSVAEWCAERGLDVAALAQQARLDARRARAILAGRWTPSPEERARVASALGVSAEEIAWGHATPVSHLYGHGPQFGRTP